MKTCKDCASLNECKKLYKISEESKACKEYKTEKNYNNVLLYFNNSELEVRKVLDLLVRYTDSNSIGSLIKRIIIRYLKDENLMFEDGNFNIKKVEKIEQDLIRNVQLKKEI